MGKKIVVKGITGLEILGTAHRAEGTSDETGVFVLVKNYLVEKKVTYGTAIDARDVLIYGGITLDTDTTGYCAALAYIEYLRLAKRVASEMRVHLAGFGYDADKNKRNDHHNVCEHIDGNVVYTRWPWDVYYKAFKSSRHAQTSMSAEHISWVDLGHFSKNVPDAVKLGSKILQCKKEASVAIDKMMANDIKPAFVAFDEYIQEHKDELVELYKNKRPANYGKYDV